MFDEREARAEILDVFAEAQHLGRYPLKLSWGEGREGSRFFRRSARSVDLGNCVVCGSRAPDHACPLETPPPRFLQLFKQPTSYPSWRKPKGRRPAQLRQFPPHEKGYRCPACGSGSNAHLCPG